MVGLQTLDLAIGVRVPASQCIIKRNVGRQPASCLPTFLLCGDCLTPVTSERERFVLHLDRSTLEERAQLQTGLVQLRF